ncbi:protogenin-like [Panulirus ornatus]|uniref:protogenin-like n=1 Tax=Panulirus ornatus TaxID=150431 RepID=UPI003A8370FA
MAWFSSMSGLLPALVLVLGVLTGTEGSGGQGSAAESDLTPGISGTWSGARGTSRKVWAARGSSVLLECGLTTSSSGSSSSSSRSRSTLPAGDWLNVTWLRNNVSVLDRRHLLTPAGHLNITKMIHRRSGVTDEGEYRCLVTTHAGIITSPPITLRLASLTKNFILTPSNVTVVVGEALRLSCQIDSQPPASLTWTHDQQPLPQDDRYTTPFSGVLHIAEVQRTDAGFYSLLRKLSQDEDADRVKEQGTELKAVDECNDAKVKVMMKMNSGEDCTILQRDLADSKVGLNYTFETSTAMTEIPQKSLEIGGLELKEPLRVIQGEHAIIECLATGVPLPIISWQRKLNISENEGWEDVKNGTKGILVIGQGTLVLSDVQNTSAGRYVCTAKSVNLATEREATVSQVKYFVLLMPFQALYWELEFNSQEHGLCVKRFSEIYNEKVGHEYLKSLKQREWCESFASSFLSIPPSGPQIPIAPVAGSFSLSHTAPTGSSSFDLGSLLNGPETDHQPYPLTLIWIPNQQRRFHTVSPLVSSSEGVLGPFASVESRPAKKRVYSVSFSTKARLAKKVSHSSTSLASFSESVLTSSVSMESRPAKKVSQIYFPRLTLREWFQSLRLNGCVLKHVACHASCHEPSICVLWKYLWYLFLKLLCLCGLHWSRSMPHLASNGHTRLSIFFSEANGIERQAVSQNASHLLENLKPNTKYTAFVRAYNNFPSDQSERLVFSTAEDVPTGAPNVRLTQRSPTVLLATWGKLPPERARGTIIGYKIHWRRLNHHYYNVIEVSADVHEYEIHDLHPGKKYEVQVLAGTKVGYPTKNDWPWIRHNMSNRNKNSIPPPPIVTLKVINDTSEDESKKFTVKIDWKLPSENTAELEGYKLKYRRQDKPWIGPVNLSPTQTSYTVIGLEADWYEVQIKAYSADGDGGATEQVIHTFPPSPNTTLPPNTTWSIYQLEADPRSQTSIHLSWKLMEGQEGAAFYTIKYKQVTHSPNVADSTFVCSKTPETVITGLIPFTTYEFSVRAHESDKIYGPFSRPVQAITMGNIPSAPEDFIYEPTDASTIRLMWGLPEDASGIIKKYEILFSLDKRKPLSEWEVQEVDGKTATASVGGLVSNTEYWFRIRSCTVIGCGATTEPLAATIPAILPPNHALSTQSLYLICGSVGFVFLMLIVIIAIYVIKSRNMSSQPRVMTCNGNGHINGKRNTQGINAGQPEGQSDVEGQDMEVYIPMLTQIPPDFKSPPLDTKGGYPDSQVNGLNNPRCNGFIRSREQLQPGYHGEAQGGSEEENEQLVFGASSSNGATSRNQSHQNHRQELGETVGRRDQPSNFLDGAQPPSPEHQHPSPAHQHNHSGASHEGLTNLTSLTTLSATDSEVGMELDKAVVGGTGQQHVNSPHQSNHHHYNSGATRASSPQPPLTTVQ